MTLPNFLVIGAAKAGTTSLHHYLDAHPDVFMTAVKEPNYFCHEEQRRARSTITTLDAYERLFAGAGSHRAIGEASPQYLNSVLALQRIASTLPAAKLVVSLRNPADRAYSSYLGRVRGGLERQDVAEAMRPGTYYFDTSLYFPSLQRYLDRFERGQIKVIVFEELVAEPHPVMREIYEFLGVDGEFDQFTAARHNRGAVPRSINLNALIMRSANAVRRIVPARFPATGLAARAQRVLLKDPPPLPAETRDRLLEQFRADVERTSSLIGIDLAARWLG